MKLRYIDIGNILGLDKWNSTGNDEVFMDNWYWWKRYGDFSPGVGNLPHMGEVIAFYRAKRYKSQTEFAIASGYSKRSVEEWESSVFTHDHERRIFLAKLLKISPALLGLDWRLVVFDNNKGEYQDPISHMVDLIEEDAYYAYEDILVMGHEYIHNGGPIDVAYRVDRRLQKLAEITRHARATDQDAWKSLLCRYYQLSTRIKQQCLMDEAAAAKHAALAVELAIDLQDAELIASAFVNSACTNDQQGKLAEARKDIASAMECVEKVRNGPLKGNIYLESANINTEFAVNDKTLQNQCRAWQDKAATMLYKGLLVPDESFVRFNLSAVHHEKAKSLLFWQKTGDDRKVVRNKLAIAIETLSPDLHVWKAYYYMTEARLNLADHDLEGSAQSGKEALKVARAMHNKIEEENVKELYYQLNKQVPNNPYICNLGVELGIFD
jgi:transcriptional regulator with XRE-family HTH domain